MLKRLIASLMLASSVAAPPPAAQDAPAQRPPAAPAVDMGDMRHHIYVMEGALARAVDFGARKLNQEMRTVMPDVFMLAGEAQARGVYLDGYGVFFDVEVPMLRQSMIWSWRQIIDNNQSQTETAIADIRKYLQGVTDPQTRATLERSLRTLEGQASARDTMPRAIPREVTPVPGVMISSEPRTAGTGAVAPAAPAAPAAEKVWATDPNRAYTEAVQKALVDAMIDYSGPMKIGADEWLTVAARDNERRDSLAPQDPYEETVTMIYRIKGSDLQAYRANKIDLEEVRRRVKIGQF